MADERAPAKQQLVPHPRKARQELHDYLNLPAALAAVLMLLLVLFQYSGKTGTPWWNPSAILLYVLWLGSIAELLLKVALSPNRWRYMTSRPHHVLFAFVPFVGIVRLVPPIKTMAAIAIRLLLPRDAVEEGPYVAALRKRQLGRLALVSAFVILIAGVLANYFEAGARGASIHGLGDAIWWSAATATTVANQLYPVTVGGEIVGFALMVYAICIVAYLMSSLASILVAGDQSAGVGGTTQAASVSTQDEARLVQLTPHEIEVLRAILSRLQPRKDEPPT